MKDNIYVLAHEMKNPLCVVKGYLEMLNSNNLEKYKSIIKEEVNTSIEILNNYLEYNKLSLIKEEFDINIFLLDIKKNMFDYLKKNGVYLKISFLDDDIYINADYNKLKQVFHNIIKNSVESGSHNINISYQIIGNVIKIIIDNDGKKCENVNLIGDNFSDKVFGNGIGINLSKKIVMLHKGKMKYFNNKKGVSCQITLSLE